MTFAHLSPVALQQGAGQGAFMRQNGTLRGIFAAALLAGVSFLGAHWLGVTGVLAIVWKGSGVALLALWCALQARSFDSQLIAAVMAFGALGDVLLETSGLTVGALAFVAGHVTAIFLYFRNGRPRITFSQCLLTALVVPLSVFIAVLLVGPKDMVPIAVYTFVVSGMAASAWISRFPRYRTGIGAMMFLASDLLIFARLGPLAGSALPGLLIWPLYFAGQVLIAWGVTQTLRQGAR
jgi:uncharacterized membrane protein YhhN